MSNIELYWDNDEQTIMLAYFSKGWTWAEMFDTLRDVRKVTEKRADLVGAIVQMEPGANVPNGSVFSQETRDKARQMLQMGASGKGPIAIVGMNVLIKAVAKALTLLDPNALDDVYFADTQDDARAILRERLAMPETTSPGRP
ncbi:MAG: hypothetical protein ACOCXZ_03105 [Chloroflexota bacterium]